MQGAIGKRFKAGAFLWIVLCVLGLGATRAVAAPPLISGTTASSVTTDSAILEAEVNPQGLATRYHFEYGTAPCASNPCTSVPAPEAELPAGSSPVKVKAPVSGLKAATIYHFRLVAKNGGTTKGPDHLVVTYSAPLGGLPDGRAYEQSSPVEKDGGDITGKSAIVKAADEGNAITFGNTFGIPGGVGAQGLPLYLAKRSASTWSTQGLFPPATTGQRALILGWLPDFSKTFANATKLGAPRTKSLLMLSTAGASPVTISPYTDEAEYSFVGSSADGSVVLFESAAKLPSKPGGEPIAVAIKGAANLYAWDVATGELKLAGIFNDGKAPPRGAFGGANPNNYNQDEHTVSADGSVYFTTLGTNQLYLRENPTQAQSPLNGEGKCTNAALACTIHVSASQKTNGISPDGTDPAGPQAATFQTATPDGSEAFFTSSEKLTNDANTGPEQPLAAIGISGIEGGIEDDEFIPAQHAIGLAVDGSHLYWVDPTTNTIGRANLDGSEANDAFIEPGPVEFEVEVETGEGEFETETITAPSSPRYVAVDGEHIYWTNSGRLDENERPAEEGGTIGRAKLDGTEVEPAFIRGASDPQGVAVNATHVYWANDNAEAANRSISRANIDGSGIVPFFVKTSNTLVPSGVGLGGNHVYFATNSIANDFGYVERAPLAGGGVDGGVFTGKAGVRGIAVEGSHVYWANQAEEEIGRADLELENPEKGLVEVEGGLNGIATNPTHIYWAVNGEAPTNPGNDLYRYRAPSGELEDLTADSSTEDGADVQGVLGASDDGSYVYFVANGDLDEGGPAKPGSCEGSVVSLEGSCSLYVWHEGAMSFIARLKRGAGGKVSDSLNWAQTPKELFGAGSYVPKTSTVSPDGATLVFRSQEKLSPYDNEGTAEFYRYREGDPEAIRCLTCNPAGEAAGGGPSTGSISFPGLQPLSTVAVQSRNMSADGNRFFFETTEALSPEDTNGQAGCAPTGPPAQRFPACLDVYEWEAPGAGSCAQGGASYSLLNSGCLYLISTGKDSFPSLIADASVSGSDVFFFTREQLVGQDKDALQDVYDARVGGGLPSQNPPPVTPCGGVEPCRGPSSPPPVESTPATQAFVGPANPAPKHKKQSKKKHKGKKKHKANKHKQKKANTQGRRGR